MSKSFIPLIMFLALNHCLAQTVVRGKVVDSKTNQGIAYVHIGILGKNIGTISRDNGDFRLELPYDLEDSPVEIFFSCIGYQSISVIVNKSNYEELLINLAERVYELTEVTVSSKKSPLKLRKLGGYMKSNYTTGNANTNSYGEGEEYGLRINAEGRGYLINKINFHTKYNTMDSVLFRLNIYRLSEKGFPEESVLRNPIFVKSYKNDKLISVNIAERKLKIENDIVLSLEPIRFWYDQNKQIGLFYSHCKNCGDSFYRQSSFAKWEKNTHAPFAIYLDVDYDGY